jgi:hypothetical protein
LHPINRLLMKRISERRIVVILFVLVFITFSFAHEESKKLELANYGYRILPAIELTASQAPKQVEPNSNLSNNALIEKTDSQ